MAAASRATKRTMNGKLTCPAWRQDFCTEEMHPQEPYWCIKHGDELLALKVAEGIAATPVRVRKMTRKELRSV